MTDPRRGVAILGSTGSVGQSTLDVLRHLASTHRVISLAAGQRSDLLMEQIREFRPRLVSLRDASAAQTLREAAGRMGTEVLGGEEAAVSVATAPGADIVVSAIVGAAGVIPTHAAVAAGRTVGLANKEVLVVAGSAILRAAQESGGHLLPIDSEHCALHQCLRAGSINEVSRLVLTASGGPFWERDSSSLESVSVAEALKHPVWQMGPKITVDSATLMNKGLEVIEARWLFQVDPSRIEMLIHREGIVHSMVEFVDGSIMAQMGKPDMRHPIQYALTWPRRLEQPRGKLDLAALSPLAFERPDDVRFPCPKLAYRALELGGTATAALNGANEALVGAFLEKRLRFPGISLGLQRVLEQVAQGEAPGSRETDPDVGVCLESDAWARWYISEHFLLDSRVETGGLGA